MLQKGCRSFACSVSEDCSYTSKWAVSLHSAIVNAPLIPTVMHTHTQTWTSTSLNSGLRVFFMTAVLCLDFLWTSGLRYLRQRSVIWSRYHAQVMVLQKGTGSNGTGSANTSDEFMHIENHSIPPGVTKCMIFFHNVTITSFLVTCSLTDDSEKVFT